MKKIIFFSLLACAAALVPQVSKAACNAEDIVIDGAYNDWLNCDVMVTDTTGENSNLQYWNNEISAWTTTDPGYNTWTVDDAGMLDLVEFKMLNDASYVYFSMKNTWPMMNIKAPDGEYYDFYKFIDFGYGLDPDLQDYDFIPLSLPDFDHWMVWSFDVEQDGLADYYFGAHLVDPSGESGDVGLAVYQDFDADGDFDAEVDTKLADIDHTDGQTSMDEGQNPGSLRFEIKQNIETFYEETGISYGDTVDVGMQTRSTIGDTVSGTEYTFDLGAPQNLTVRNKKAKRVKLMWKNNNNANQYTVRLFTKKGKKLRTIKKITKRYQTVRGLTSGNTYKYKARAIDKRLNKANIKSSWSKFKSFKTN